MEIIGDMDLTFHQSFCSYPNGGIFTTKLHSEN